MPPHAANAQPPATAGDPGRPTGTADGEARPTPPHVYATSAAQRADELHRRAAALLQRANTQLQRADARLASSYRRLTSS